MKTDAETPNGKCCTIPNETLAELIRTTARGSFQREVCEFLIRNGYIIGYLPTGVQLRGKAKSYQSKYARSVSNLMDRIENVLPESLDLCSGSVGPKGAFGYRLVSGGNS